MTEVIFLCLLCRQRPALGECLAHLAAAMPVAYLEPHLNEFNAFSVYTTKTPRERASECDALFYLIVCCHQNQKLKNDFSQLLL